MQDGVAHFLFAVGWMGLLGWAGSLLYLANHAALSALRAYPERVYLLGNLVAAVLVGAASLALHSWQSVGVNLFWAAVSLQGLAGREVHARMLSERWFRRLTGLMVSGGVMAAAVSLRLSADLLGWASVAGFCGVYFLFANHEVGRPAYFLYNVLAALLILPVLWLDRNWPVFALEACWAVLSFGAFLKHRGPAGAG